MKVLQINSVCGIRSTGRICTDIAKILEKSGYDCKIAYGRETVSDEYKKYAIRIGTNTDVNINALQARLFDNDGFGLKRATNRFVKWIKEYDPDVIHLHNLHGYYINVEVLFNYLKKANKPVIWTLHDCWPFTGHCAYFSYAQCDKWKIGTCGNCPLKRTYPSSLLFDNSTKNLHIKKSLFTGLENLTVVTPSEWLANLVKQSFLGDYPIKVVHNGIDLKIFKPTPNDFKKRFGLENKKIILGVASFWSHRKGLDDFLKLSQMISDNFKIVLVGLNETQLKNLPDNIIGIAKTNSVKELAEIYTAADVFFNPTYEDNYPTVNLEAQACGTPVITYKTGGSIESVPEENVVAQGELPQVCNRIVGADLNDLPINDCALFSATDRYNEYIDLYKNTVKN